MFINLKSVITLGHVVGGSGSSESSAQTVAALSPDGTSLLGLHTRSTDSAFPLKLRPPLAIDDSTYELGPLSKIGGAAALCFLELWALGTRGVSLVGVALSIHDKIIILSEGRCFKEAVARASQEEMDEVINTNIP